MGNQTSSGFEQLHEGVQRWIWEQGWPKLRPIQEQAIAPILSGETDLIISAATAGGKTEAAFLPIFSRLKQDPGSGIRVLGLSPLKALINDQHRRLSELGDRVNIPVHPWHGDVPGNRKQRVLKNPEGIVLITPESLEALLARRGSTLANLFVNLNYIVIDEMHAFIGLERGRQLQSLMHRVELVIQRFLPRIGLSATLGDMSLAGEFLRPGKSSAVTYINPPGAGGELKMQIKGYRQTEADLEALQMGADASRDQLDICQHLFKTMRGTNNLIFVNGRARVEKYADLLRRLCEQAHVPNEFWPHHGSLAKEIRAHTEDILRSDRPSNVVCTTTLEMGIDVGSVTSIAQVGAPFSVASMRQRLGRSGRRKGEPAIARFYITASQMDPEVHPLDALHPELVQATALMQLLLEGWCEPPVLGQLDLSTLIQQFLSMIAQHGGVKAADAWQVLCQTGPFQAVDQTMFTTLLRSLGQQEMIQQSQDGLLLLGPKGERQVNHYTFFTAFQTAEEYRLVHEGKTLGNLPMQVPLVAEMQIIFAGRRWRVLTADDITRMVDVEPAATGKVPRFSGSSGHVHNRIRQKMYELFCSNAIPAFLDATAKTLLNEARTNFVEYGLDQQSLLDIGKQVLLFCWQGDVVMNTIMVQLLARGVKASKDGLAIAVRKLSPEEVMGHLGEMVDEGPADAVSLAASVKNKVNGKYDRLLSDDLLSQNYAASHLDTQRAWETLKKLVDL